MNWAERRPQLYKLAAIPLLLYAIGCSSKSSSELYPVKGRVLVRGKPAAGAELAFYDKKGHLLAPDAPFPRATTDSNGSFQVQSRRPADGAPAGDYVVTVVWHENHSADPELRTDSPDQLRGRYATPDSSNIEVTVKAQENVLADFELD